MLQREVLVCEAFAVDRLASTTVPVSEVASLEFVGMREKGSTWHMNWGMIRCRVQPL